MLLVAWTSYTQSFHVSMHRSVGTKHEPVREPSRQIHGPAHENRVRLIQSLGLMGLAANAMGLEPAHKMGADPYRTRVSWA